MLTDNIYIYGVGKYGITCFRFLEQTKGVTNVRGFIVSDGYDKDEKFEDRKILSLSEAVYEQIRGTIILALSERYRDSVLNSLLNTSLRNSCQIAVISSDDYYEMYRNVYSIDMGSFLLHSKPADDSNGGERGTTLSRHYIRKFLDYATSKVDIEGVINTYEVGDLRYSTDYYPNANHMMLDYKKGEDLTKMDSLPETRFDVFLCTQVYNFLFDVPAAIRGSYYVLKDGGYLLCTVAGNISQVIRGDMEDYGDYWRFTYLGIRRLIEQVFDAEKIEVISYGNALAATAYLQGLSVEDLPKKELLDELDPEYAVVIGIIARK